MFKNTSIWCIILAIVVVMIVHHIISDKPLLEGNVNDKTTLKDENVKCESWAKNGWCTKNPNYMLKSCAESCSKVVGSPANPANPSTPANPGTPATHGTPSTSSTPAGQTPPAENNESEVTTNTAPLIPEEESVQNKLETKIVPGTVKITYRGSVEDVSKMMNYKKTSVDGNAAPAGVDVGAGSETSGDTNVPPSVTPDGAATPPSPASAEPKTGENGVKIGKYLHYPSTDLKGEKTDAYTFYPGVLKFRGQKSSSLMCKHTLNSQKGPSGLMNACNGVDDCNGFFVYSKDGSGGKKNSGRVCFKDNVNISKMHRKTKNKSWSKNYGNAGFYVLTGEKPMLKCNGQLYNKGCGELNKNNKNLCDNAYQLIGSDYKQCYLDKKDNTCKSRQIPCKV